MKNIIKKVGMFCLSIAVSVAAYYTATFKPCVTHINVAAAMLISSTMWVACFMYINNLNFLEDEDEKDILEIHEIKEEKEDEKVE